MKHDPEFPELHPFCSNAREICGYGTIVVLFGSRVSGDIHHWSDWDLVVISRELTSSEKRKLHGVVDLNLDLHFFDYTDFETYLHDWKIRQEQSEEALHANTDSRCWIVSESIDGVCLVGQEQFQRFRDLRNDWIAQGAIPDPALRTYSSMEDGLTHVQRSILEALPGSRSRFIKSSQVVGKAMGSGAGTSLVYRTIIAMAQPWTTRYPLISFQGNCGSEQGDPPAGMRYTECRASKWREFGLAERALIPPETLLALSDEFRAMAEGQPLSREDVAEAFTNLLPEGGNMQSLIFPNILANGTLGLPKTESSIPPFWLGGVADAIELAITNPQSGDDALLDAIGLPDLPSGGRLVNLDEVRTALESGTGTIKVSACGDAVAATISEVSVNLTVIEDGKLAKKSMAELIRFTADRTLRRHDGKKSDANNELELLRQIEGQPRRTAPSSWNPSDA